RGCLPFPRPLLRRERRRPRVHPDPTGHAEVSTATGFSVRPSPTDPPLFSRQLCRDRHLIGRGPPSDGPDLRHVGTERRTFQRGVLLHRPNRREPALHHPRGGVHLVLCGGLARKCRPPPRRTTGHPVERVPPDSRDCGLVDLLRSDVAIVRGREPWVRGQRGDPTPHYDVRVDPRLSERDLGDPRPGAEEDAPPDPFGDDRQLDHPWPRMVSLAKSRPGNRWTRVRLRIRPSRRDSVLVFRGTAGVRGGPLGTFPGATPGVIMATAIATPHVESVRMSRWTYLLGYLGAVIAAEILIAIPGGATGTDRPFQSIG